MIELKLRGYVTPEDFEGTDAERIQKALDCADKEDIRKVILSGTYKADKTIVIPGGMHIIFDNAHLYGNIKNDVKKNFSLVTDRVYIEGKNSEITGDVSFCHTSHLVLENLTINGDVTFDFALDTRIEYVKISGRLSVNRGCMNAIIQHIECDNMLMSGEKKDEDVIGREPIMKSIVVRDAKIKNGALLKAAEDCGFLNVQFDDIKSDDTCITVGAAGESLPRELYQNFTFVNLDAPEKIVFNNDYKYAYTD